MTVTVTVCNCDYNNYSFPCSMKDSTVLIRAAKFELPECIKFLTGHYDIQYIILSCYLIIIRIFAGPIWKPQYCVMLHLLRHWYTVQFCFVLKALIWRHGNFKLQQIKILFSSETLFQSCLAGLNTPMNLNNMPFLPDRKLHFWDHSFSSISL